MYVENNRKKYLDLINISKSILKLRKVLVNERDQF